MKIYKNLLKLREIHKDEIWPFTQHRLEKANIPEISVEDAINILIGLKNKLTKNSKINRSDFQLPILFFDEFLKHDKNIESNA
jgi:hypothetical protein